MRAFALTLNADVRLRLNEGTSTPATPTRYGVPHSSDPAWLDHVRRATGASQPVSPRGEPHQLERSCCCEKCIWLRAIAIGQALNL